MEDLISEVANAHTSSKLEAVDYEFVSSIAHQIAVGKSLTTRQAYAIRTALRKYTPHASDYSKQTPAQFREILDANQWRGELRVTVQKRNEARYLGDNIVAISYQAKQEAIQEAKRLRAVWRDGIQIITVSRSNIEAVIDFIGTHRFEIDDELESYLALCMASKGQMSHLVYDQGSVVCNVTDSETLSLFLMHAVGAQRI